MDPAPVANPLNGTAWCANCDRLIYRLLTRGPTGLTGGRWYHRHNASTICTGSTGRAKP